MLNGSNHPRPNSSVTRTRLKVNMFFTRSISSNIKHGNPLRAAMVFQWFCFIARRKIMRSCNGVPSAGLTCYPVTYNFITFSEIYHTKWTGIPSSTRPLYTAKPTPPVKRLRQIQANDQNDPHRDSYSVRFIQHRISCKMVFFWSASGPKPMLFFRLSCL